MQKSFGKNFIYYGKEEKNNNTAQKRYLSFKLIIDKVKLSQ